MKESASIALDYLKANKEKYGLDDKAFEKQDIHIHVPEGAIKKDGPSAGVTLTTAIYSAFTNKPVRDDVADDWRNHFTWKCSTNWWIKRKIYFSTSFWN